MSLSNSLSKQGVSKALSILKGIIAEAESLEVATPDELRILQGTADRLDSPLFQTLVEIQRQQQEDVECLQMGRRSSIGDEVDQTPVATFNEQKQTQTRLHSHANSTDQAHQYRDKLSNGDGGKGNVLTSGDELSPKFINPIMCDQDGSAGVMHGTLLAQNSGEEHEEFDFGNDACFQSKFTSSGRRTPPPLDYNSLNATTVFSEGISLSPQPRESGKKSLSSNGAGSESLEKKGVCLDLLSPMREEKSLLAIKAAVHSRKSRTVALIQSSGGLGLDIVGLTNVGLFINGIQAGSVAEDCGQIQQGDQVLEVNGMSCENLASFELTHKIKQFTLGAEITFTLQYNPIGLADYLRQYS